MKKQNKQKLVIDCNNRTIVHIKARLRDDLNLEDGELYCVKKGRGRTLIVKFDKKEQKQ